MIDFCAYECERGEVQPLYACALTCRRWLPRSRLHLYHFVKLSARSHFRKFLATVKGSFVRKLDLGDIDSSSQEPVAPRKELASKYTYGDRQNSEWICLVPVYSTIIRILTTTYYVPPIHQGPVNRGANRDLSKQGPARSSYSGFTVNIWCRSSG